jgi:hypothetical protein
VVECGATDALLAQLGIRFELMLLTTDADILGIAAHHPLDVWHA